MFENERPKLTKRGAWIIVTKFIPTVIPVRPYSIFYAKPEVRNIGKMDLASFLLDGEDDSPQIFAKVNTEYGPVWLQPHEYNVLTSDLFGEYLKAVEEQEYTMHFYAEVGKGRFKAQSKKLTEAVFYCRSRGISFVNAIIICTGIVNSPSVFYLRIGEEGLNYFCHQWDVDSLLEKERAYAERYTDYNENDELEVMVAT